MEKPITTATEEVLFVLNNSINLDSWRFTTPAFDGDDQKPRTAEDILGAMSGWEFFEKIIALDLDTLKSRDITEDIFPEYYHQNRWRFEDSQQGDDVYIEPVYAEMAQDLGYYTPDSPLPNPDDEHRLTAAQMGIGRAR